jgi:effector-binding domain-containing protein
MPATYDVSIRSMPPRAIACVRATMPGAKVASSFGAHLNQIYDLAKAGGVSLDGQNVFVYRQNPSGELDVEFGVGLASPFDGAGSVVQSETPSGEAATTTHWRDYALGDAHAAIVSWCRANGRRLAGPSWEVYGHWSDDPSKVRTDIYYLLERA